VDRCVRLGLEGEAIVNVWETTGERSRSQDAQPDVAWRAPRRFKGWLWYLVTVILTD
jgi:hypothetical protein